MQSAASDVIQKSRFIRAGAGAGKTTRLIKTFLDFVKEFRRQNGRLPRVVMTTFTRKATQEVKERLLVSALKENEKEIFEYINQKSYVHISTIHGLLSLFLSQYSELLKFPQEIKVVEGPHSVRNLKKQINELLKKNTAYIELLDQYSFNGLVEISKKSLEFRSQYSDLSYVNAEELKQLSLKRQNEMIGIIDEIFVKSGEPSEAWHNYFEFLSRLKNALKNGQIESFLELLNEAPNKPQWKEAKPSLDPAAHELVLELRDNYFKLLFDSDSYIQKHEALNSLYFKYINDLFILNTQYKQNTGELTISDLENLTWQLIEKHPEAVQEFSEAWDYFMVDEYQDTSPLQTRILNHIVGQKPCFVVGDPQQSIYLFRGARSEVFSQKQNEMEASKAHIDILNVNYRSEPSLMTYINDFFDKFSHQFKPMQTKEESSKSKKISYDAFYVKTENQALGVLKHIRFLVSEGALPKDICVLSRNNKSLEDIAVLAAQAGVNVQLQAAAGFEEKREILDLISFNKFLNNPHDDENLITLVRSPWFYIPDEQILELNKYRQKNKCSYWAAICAVKAPQKAKLLSYLSLFEAAGCLLAAQHFITENQFVGLSAYYDSTGKREANIFKYLMALAANEKTAGFSLGLFLEEQFQSLQIESGSANAEAQPVEQPDCVSLMTVHSSKGLQFKHVIVLGFADSVKVSVTPQLGFSPDQKKISLSVFDEDEAKFKPSFWSQQLRRQLNERERSEADRVLYVAMTRAIESLSLVADTSKRGDKTSWISRLTWPETGELTEQKFKTLSLEYDTEPVTTSEKMHHRFSARPKLSEASSAVDAAATSVTALISAQTQSKDKIDFTRQLNNLKKAQFGSDLHRIFESLKYQQFDSLKQKLSPGELEAVQFLFESRELDIKKVIEVGHSEWGFGLKTKSSFLQGQIDLWAELENEIHVLDYKTGSSVYADKAFEQLAFYTMALYQMQQVSDTKKIVHSVVYPVEKSIRVKIFSNRAEFENLLSAKIKELF